MTRRFSSHLTTGALAAASLHTLLLTGAASGQDYNYAVVDTEYHSWAANNLGSEYSVTGTETYDGLFVGVSGEGTVDHAEGTINTAVLVMATNSSSGTGIYNLSGSGVLNVDPSYGATYFGNGGIQATFNQSGGTATFGQLNIGTSSAGAYNLSGGTATTFSTLLGNQNAVGVFTQTGGTFTTSSLQLGSAGTYHLQGGTLNAGGISANAATNNRFNFNGGILQATYNNSSFMSGGLQVRVRAGGAKIDTDGRNVGIPVAILHDSAMGTTADGGLTKQTGTGILTLSGANTYTGVTSVRAGTLLVNGTHTVGSGTTGSYAVESGGTLGGTGTINLSAVNRSVVIKSGGKLAPGASAGTLTLNLGLGALDLTGAISAANVASLVFELGAPGASDQVLLTSGILNIGTENLGFSDFAFTTLPGFTSGVYTLFDSAGAIQGTLSPSDLSGPIGTQTGTLSVAPNGQDILLTVIPEPSTSGLLAAASTTAVLLRRRPRCPAAI